MKIKFYNQNGKLVLETNSTESPQKGDSVFIDDGKFEIIAKKWYYYEEADDVLVISGNYIALP